MPRILRYGLLFLLLCASSFSLFSQDTVTLPEWSELERLLLDYQAELKRTNEELNQALAITEKQENQLMQSESELERLSNLLEEQEKRLEANLSESEQNQNYLNDLTLSLQRIETSRNIWQGVSAGLGVVSAVGWILWGLK